MFVPRLMSGLLQMFRCVMNMTVMDPVLQRSSDVCFDVINVTLSDTALLSRLSCSGGQQTRRASEVPVEMGASGLAPAGVGLVYKSVL